MPLFVSSPAGSPGPKTQYVPVVSGLENADQAVFVALGAHPTIDPTTLGSGSKGYRFKAILNIPAGSTAEWQLYDVTNHAVIAGTAGSQAGPANQLEIDVAIALADGPHQLEFDMLTNPNAGGSANVEAAGVLVTWA